MNFWSEGLGSRELVMGLDRSELERNEKGVVLTGIVDAPAPWEYEVVVHLDDWRAILNTATSREAGDFIAKSVGLGMALKMGWYIVKLIVLLGLYRLPRMMGLVRKKYTEVVE
ncbi:MAG: hypothetical protein M0Q95_02030 [Porticoccaceae bacterium]|jgi:hypothetical protein|nr:hypothetical protein [Porticoccaceae bacterium]